MKKWTWKSKAPNIGKYLAAFSTYQSKLDEVESEMLRMLCELKYGEWKLYQTIEQSTDDDTLRGDRVFCDDGDRDRIRSLGLTLRSRAHQLMWSLAHIYDKPLPPEEYEQFVPEFEDEMQRYQCFDSGFPICIDYERWWAYKDEQKKKWRAEAKLKKQQEKSK